MNIHEYQAKEILKGYGVKIQEGIVADTPEAALNAAKKLKADTGTEWYVIKAQIHAGGRGKGKISQTGSNGVVLAKSLDEVSEKAKNILGGTLVTHQTGPDGKTVSKVLIAQDVYYPGESEPKEYYMSILLDRAKGCNVIMASTEGGMDIETVAAETPEKIVKVTVDPAVGLQQYQARKLAFTLGLSGLQHKNTVKFLMGLYKTYEGTDASLVEVNPLVITKEGNVIALDAKMDFDDNALYRHKEIKEYRDPDEEDSLEVEASKYDLNYIKLDGNVGCMVNGAGLAMATMDIIKLAGGEPANFLDVGGGANKTTVANGFKIILSDSNVKAILINIFGGIVRCDRVAQGVIDAAKQMHVTVPIVVRLEGTNAKEARELLHKSGINFEVANSLKDAAEKVTTVLEN